MSSTEPDANITLEIPLGLKQLILLDKVLVVGQKTGYFQGRKYDVTTPANDVILTAQEQELQLFSSAKSRGFRFIVSDSKKCEVAQFFRNERLIASSMGVFCSGGRQIEVQEKVTLIDTVLYIRDPTAVIRIKGLAINSEGCVYELQTIDKERIGHVKKLSQGFWQDLFGSLNRYEVQFPADLDVHFKVAVIGACILIDYLNHVTS